MEKEDSVTEDELGRGEKQAHGDVRKRAVAHQGARERRRCGRQTEGETAHIGKKTGTGAEGWMPALEDGGEAMLYVVSNGGSG